MKHKDPFPLELASYKKCGKDSSCQGTPRTKKKGKKKKKKKEVNPQFDSQISYKRKSQDSDSVLTAKIVVSTFPTKFRTENGNK